MRKKIIASLSVFVAIGLLSQAAWLAAEPDVGRETERTPQRSPTTASGDDRFVVHEWGTFTTFSGSDGVFVDFRPLAAEHSDLPNYVLDRGSYSKGFFLSKSRLWGRVRMETPVTYFYTDRIRSVDVSVDFPQGLLTEFYPPIESMMPAIDETKIFGKGEAIGKSRLDWGTIDLIPLHQLAPNVPDSKTRQEIVDGIVNKLVPHGVNEQHYAEARATDSALVHFRGKAGRNSKIDSHFEKFLFYRGVGRFQLPITAAFRDSEVVMNNDGALPIRSAILVDVDGKSIKIAKRNQISAGGSISFGTTKRVSPEELGDLVVDCLVDEGLYRKEAVSMVKTWQRSWFTENGTRILYMVPGPTTDELLPLNVNPAPDETLRVLVGRMEIMSPEAEKEMARAVERSAKKRVEHIAQQKKASKKKGYPIPAEIMEFGRMAEPALIRVGKLAKDDSIRRESKMLVAQLQAR